MAVLIVYASSEGQTAKVADHLGDVLREHDVEFEEYAVGGVPGDLDLGDYDGVLLGASVHMGKHQKSMRKFVKRHREALVDAYSGFFQVSLSSASDDEQRQREAADYVENLVDETGWEPDHVGVFGGALKFSEYGFIKGKLMKAIASGMGDVDTAADQEFTDWAEVTAFAEAFLSGLEGVDVGESAI